MNVEIVSPVCKCPYDEKIFFSRLKDISGYQSALGKGSNLRLSFVGGSDEFVVSELQKICDMWNTSFSVLEND